MATTVNNTTVQSRITIIFDAAGPLTGDGPAKGTGNTESDVYLDDNIQLNIRSHTEIDSNIHALQWDATTNTGQIEFTDTRDNESISSFSFTPVFLEILDNSFITSCGSMSFISGFSSTLIILGLAISFAD